MRRRSQKRRNARRIQSGESDEAIVDALKDQLLRGYIKEIYPEDAAKLNFSIMIALVKKELLAE